VRYEDLSRWRAYAIAELKKQLGGEPVTRRPVAGNTSLLRLASNLYQLHT
jgi:hypothetical protein